MKTTKIIISDTLKKKLTMIGEQFLDHGIITKILELTQSAYTVADLVRLGLISVIKNNTRYLNRCYDRYVAPEAVIGLYCQGDDRMIGGLGVYNNFGRTTQVAQRTVVYNTKISGKKIIAGCRFIFYKKRASFFRGRIRKQKYGVYYYVMSQTRAFLQMLIDYRGILEFEDDIKEQFQEGILSKQELQKIATQYCSKTEQKLLSSFLHHLG